jgi:hypothetical protein
MIELIRFVFNFFWGFFSQIPMPWRMVSEILVCLFFVPLILFQVIPRLINLLFVLALYFSEFLTKLLVLPEALLAQFFRQRGKDVPHFLYWLGEILRVILRVLFDFTEKSTLWKNSWTKKSYLLNLKWLIMIGVILPVVWYSRPALGDNSLASFVDNIVSWWTSSEGWLSSGNWKTEKPASITPERFVLDYFSDINNRDTAKAWKSLTPSFQSNKRLMPNGYESYKDWWGNQVQEVRIANVVTELRDFNSARVKVYWSYQASGDTEFSQEMNLTLYLLLDKKLGRWLINESES